MKTKVREKANWPVTILLILGLITVVFPLYMTIVIAFKQPTESVYRFPRHQLAMPELL